MSGEVRILSKLFFGDFKLAVPLCSVLLVGLSLPLDLKCLFRYECRIITPIFGERSLIEFPNLGDRPVQQKVGIVFTRVLGKKQRLYDSDSILRGNVKELLDSIVDFGILGDDNNDHVLWSLGLQDKERRSEGPLTEVSFYGAE